MSKPNAYSRQVGGDHYKRMGVYQPWKVLKAWLTPEEYRGYQKSTAIAYLARERAKGGKIDIEKAAHTLQDLVESLNSGAATTENKEEKDNGNSRSSTECPEATSFSTYGKPFA